MGSEKNFENRVKKWLREQGCYVIKFYGCGNTRSGVPDLLICAKGRFIAVELKSEDGIISELQKKQIDLIKRSGGDALVLYPHDFGKFKAYIRTIVHGDSKRSDKYDRQGH